MYLNCNTPAKSFATFTFPRPRPSELQARSPARRAGLSELTARKTHGRGSCEAGGGIRHTSNARRWGDFVARLGDLDHGEAVAIEMPS
jgi:hypothetical protein